MFHQNTVPSIISCDMQLRTLLSDATTFWCVLLCCICFPEQHSTYLRIVQTPTSTDQHQRHKVSSVLSFEGVLLQVKTFSDLVLSGALFVTKLSACEVCRAYVQKDLWKENHYIWKGMYIYIYTYIKKKYKGTAVGSKDITGIKKTIKTAISLRFQLAASRKPALSHVNVFKRDKKQAWFEAGSWHATHKPVRYLTREPYTYQVIRIQRKLGWETSDAQGF